MKPVFTRMMVAVVLLATVSVEAKMVTLADVTQGRLYETIFLF